MKKIIFKFCYYSNVIIYWLFWGYFFLLIIYRFFVSEYIHPLMAYFFFLLLGIYLGYKLCRKAYDYLKENQ